MTFLQKSYRFLAIAFAIGVMGISAKSQAQFSNTVVVLKGVVSSEQTGAPVAAKVSVRIANDTALEVTASRSNASTGNYLLVLKPGKKYWVHIEGENIFERDTLIETPTVDHYQQIVQNFAVLELRETGAIDPAKKP